MNPGMNNRIVGCQSLVDKGLAKMTVQFLHKQWSVVHVRLSIVYKLLGQLDPEAKLDQVLPCSMKEP